jgi:hypothetical protein
MFAIPMGTSSESATASMMTTMIDAACGHRSSRRSASRLDHLDLSLKVCCSSGESIRHWSKWDSSAIFLDYLIQESVLETPVVMYRPAGVEDRERDRPM